MVKRTESFIQKLKPWEFINFLCKHNFMASILQRTYHVFFSYPKVLQLHINSECNYNCIYCYAKKEVKPLETKKWLSIIDEAEDLGISYLEILGGEPFLDKSLERILDYAITKNFKVTIYTNGLLINDYWVKKLKSLKENIIISIKYGYHKQVIDNHLLEKKIKEVEAVIKRLVNEDVPIVTFITVDRFNFSDIKKILNKAIELKTFPIVERYIPIEDKKINQRFSLTKEQWTETLKLIKEIYSKYSPVIYGKAYTRGKICSCFTDNLSITPAGSVLPCPFSSNSLSLGNVREESLKEIWKKFLKKRKEWIKIPKECKSCKNRYLCRGGCKTTSISLRGDASRKDPLCNGGIPVTLGHAAFSLIHDNKNVELKKIR